MLRRTYLKKGNILKILLSGAALCIATSQEGEAAQAAGMRRRAQQALADAQQQVAAGNAQAAQAALAQVGTIAKQMPQAINPAIQQEVQQVSEVMVENRVAQAEAQAAAGNHAAAQEALREAEGVRAQVQQINPGVAPIPAPVQGRIAAVERLVGHGGGGVPPLVPQAPLPPQAGPQVARVVAVNARDRISQAIQGDRARFGYLDNPAKINAIIGYFNGLGPLPADNIVLAFAEKICTDNFTAPGTAIADAIMRVRQVLEVMKNTDPAKTILNNGSYNRAKDQRDHIYSYIDLVGGNRLNVADFDNAIGELKRALGLAAHEVIDAGANLTFETAYAIKKFETEAATEKADLTRDFGAKQAALKRRVDPANNGPDRYHLRVAGYPDVDLNANWNNGVAEIDAIARAKAADPVRLDYKRLTYEDIYSKFFTVDYVDPPAADIVNIKDILIRLAPTNLSDVARYAPDLDYNAEFHAGMWNRPPNNQRAVFIHQATERLDALAARGNDNYHFQARVKNLFEKASEFEIPAAVIRPGQPGHNPAQWNQELENAQFTVGTFLVASLEGCDTGKNGKLGNLESRYRDVLGNTNPRIKAMKAIASIVTNLKEERIKEVGRNPNAARYEENVTAPQVLFQRLSGPFGLLKDYVYIVGAGLGLPFEGKNHPEQIIKNMFLPGQPNRPYYSEGNEAGNRVEVPVAPPLTVRSLVEAVYDEFDKSIPRKFINEEYAKGNLALIKDQMPAIINGADGVFIKAAPQHGVITAKDEFTREMAFFMLEHMGYIEIDPAIKAAVYAYDEVNDRPGTAIVGGHRLSLKELIDRY
jgi:hypothetical protein